MQDPQSAQRGFADISLLDMRRLVPDAEQTNIRMQFSHSAAHGFAHDTCEDRLRMHGPQSAQRGFADISLLNMRRFVPDAEHAKAMLADSRTRRCPLAVDP